MAEVRSFPSGATRDVDINKPSFRGFLSPAVLAEYANYMHKNRTQKDGSVRRPDNWKLGIPLEAYMDSGWRHFFDWYALHEGENQVAKEDLKTALCALLFNVMGYLHEVLKAEKAANQPGQVISLTGVNEPVSVRIPFTKIN